MSRLFRLMLLCCSLAVSGCGGSDSVDVPEEAPPMPADPTDMNSGGQQSLD